MNTAISQRDSVHFVLLQGFSEACRGARLHAVPIGGRAIWTQCWILIGNDGAWRPKVKFGKNFSGDDFIFQCAV